MGCLYLDLDLLIYEHSLVASHMMNAAQSSRAIVSVSEGALIMGSFC